LRIRFIWLLAFIVVLNFVRHNLLLLIVLAVPAVIIALVFVSLGLRLGIPFLGRLLSASVARREGQTPPQSADDLLNYGVELYEQDEPERALEVFNRVASASNPSAQAAAWLNVGPISEDLGRTEDAEAAWDKSLASSTIAKISLAYWVRNVHRFYGPRCRAAHTAPARHS
jgi:tetratricopeptide (TPR) repeat protein